ncbi:hypothetical protein SLA2020_520140 [Shorea laevis]
MSAESNASGGRISGKEKGPVTAREKVDGVLLSWFANGLDLISKAMIAQVQNCFRKDARSGISLFPLELSPHTWHDSTSSRGQCKG